MIRKKCLHDVAHGQRVIQCTKYEIWKTLFLVQECLHGIEVSIHNNLGSDPRQIQKL